MGEPVDTSVRDAMLYLQRWEESLRLQAATRLTGTPLPKDFVCASRHEIEAVARHVRRLQSKVTAAQQRIADLEAQCARVQKAVRADAAFCEANGGCCFERSLAALGSAKEGE